MNAMTTMNPMDPVRGQARFHKALVWFVLFLIVVPNLVVSLSTARSRGGDFRGFLIAGERLLAGTFLYEDSRVGTNVTWPPFFAVFIAPFALLARMNLPLTQMLWYCINILLFFYSVHLWCRLSYGKPLGGFDSRKDLSFYSSAVLVPILLVTDPLMRNFVQLQINPLILFLLTLGFVRLHEGREGTAGIWLGLAAALKAFPVLVLVVLVFRRRIRAALSMGLAGLVFTAMPAFRYGIPSYAEHLKAWVGLSLAGGYPIGSLNQSVYAMVTRWIASDPVLLMKMKLAPPATDDPRAVAAMWVYRGLLLSFFSVFLYIAYRKPFRRPDAEAAFWIVLGMAFSPLAWMHYWVLLFPAVFVAWRDASVLRNRIVQCLFWISAFLVTGMNVLDRFYRPIGSLAHSVVSNMTLGALILLVAMLAIMASGEGATTVAGLRVARAGQPEP
jgi:hypothetical protein